MLLVLEDKSDTAEHRNEKNEWLFHCSDSANSVWCLVLICVLMQTVYAGDEELSYQVVGIALLHE
jgi:hypothetical protein